MSAQPHHEPPAKPPWLTPEELHELTGYQRPSKQIEWLRRWHVRFMVARDGHPRVLRAELERPAAQPRRVPNLDAPELRGKLQ